MSFLPGWDSLDTTETIAHNLHIIAVIVLGLLFLAEGMALVYDFRNHSLGRTATIEADKQRQRDADAAEDRRRSEVGALQKQLSDADKKMAELEKQQAPRRLTQDQRQTLIAALTPYRGQKIAILTILGDTECKRFMEDFLEVFDAAGWDYGHGSRVTYNQFGGGSDPVGVILAVNAALAAQKKGPHGVLPLMDVLAKFGLVLPNTLSSADVQPEEVALIIGRKP